MWSENFVNATFLERNILSLNGTRYLQGNNSRHQGGYECSIRSVSEWEDYRSGYIHNHPNYYSRYMNEKIEDDGNIYSHWKGMDYPPTHRKTQVLIKYDSEYLNRSMYNKIAFVYTDRGYMKDGIWELTGENWVKGLCVVEFERRCEGEGPVTSLVQDTDEV